MLAVLTIGPVVNGQAQNRHAVIVLYLMLSSYTQCQGLSEREPMVAVGHSTYHRAHSQWSGPESTCCQC